MIRRFVTRHVLWVGLAAVLLPLGTLLAMQYRWLVELQEKSAVAEKAYLKNYLEAVSSKVEYFYRKQAERALNIPDALLLRDDAHKVIWHFRSKEPSGARLLFVANFVHPAWDEIVLYDPETEVFGAPAKPDIAQAILVAVAPWRSLREKRATPQTIGLEVEENDPLNRIILNPLVGEDGEVMGVAGMILDPRYFLHDVLPTAIGQSLPHFFDSGIWNDLLISVRDGEGHVLIGAGADLDPYMNARGRMPFIFSDWELAMGSRGQTPEEWAQSNFLLNVTLSALLALALLAGIVLALRTASREIRLSRMKSEFVSNVSHELRTPLASIRVFGEFLRLGRVTGEPKVREYGDYIETESRRLTRLVDNILDFSRIESGARTYRFEPHDVAAVAADTLRTLELRLKHSGHRLEFRGGPGLPDAMDLDRDALSRALANLVDNAVKHSPSGTAVTVELTAGASEVRIAVVDEGIGIPREEQRRIFDRFHRVSTGLVHDVKGSGLGLTIVDHIVQAHGGRVTVESEVGKGSRFTIHLPVRPAGRASMPSQVEEHV